jgi:hypothetical protein
MKIFSDPKFYLVVFISSFFGLLMNNINLKNDLAKCQVEKNVIPNCDIENGRLQEKIDSLESEIFIKSTEIGRYEMTLEWLKETNPKAHQQFDYYLTTQTE